jgi:hypothetical protein
MTYKCKDFATMSDYFARYHGLMTSDGGMFACCIANSMTGAVRCVMTTAKDDLTRAKAADGP